MDSRKHARWAVLSVLVALAAGCQWPEIEGSGHLVTEERQISAFTGIQAANGIDVTVLVDATQQQQVRVVGDDNLVERVHTDLQGGDLRVEFRDGDVRNWTSPNPLRVEVVMARLEAVESSGGSTVDLNGGISATTFALASSGGGTVKARGLDVEELILDASGGADVTLEGRADLLTSNTSGGSALRARGLATRDARLDSSGGGLTTARVSDTLRVSASGGAEIRIVGQPAVLSKDLSGGSILQFE